MLLFIDIGNSTIHFYGQSSDKIEDLGFTQTHAPSFDSLLLNLKDKSIDKCLIASVVPSQTDLVFNLCKKITSYVRLLKYQDLDLASPLLEPERAGIDRLLNVKSALELANTPVIVVDIGTAITVDCGLPPNIFLGGAILPGPNLWITALATQTEQLPKINLQKPDITIGRSTTEALQSGIYFGIIGAIKSLIDEIQKHDSELKKAKLFLTGGWAQTFKNDLSELEWTPNLMMRCVTKNPNR